MDGWAIEADGLSRAFDGLVAVEGVSLRIPRGQVFSLLGPNGAGKTTTVRMLTTLIAPTVGHARVAGFDIRAQSLEVRRRIGLLTEVPGLYDSLSARRNLEFSADLHGMPRARRDARLREVLEALGIWGRRDERVATFSKGMKQKIAIARALVHEPEVLFLDEPTASLDPESSKVVRDYILQIKAAGGTIFLNTHNLYEAERVSDAVAIISRRILATGAPRDLARTLWRPRTEVRLRALTPALLEEARAAPGVLAAEPEGTSLHLELEDPARDVPAVVAHLVRAGAEVLGVGELGHSLEDVYLRLLASSQGVPA
ncbi:MAG TPA: ABC transporter ATP-binding protein [Thermoplasmata archaeon]|nr:ABC transporter ATP-binding protein [Thermoplasmata archaeon]